MFLYFFTFHYYTFVDKWQIQLNSPILASSTNKLLSMWRIGNQTGFTLISSYLSLRIKREELKNFVIFKNEIG